MSGRTLIYGGSYPAIRLAGHDYFCNFIRGEIAQAKLFELAFLEHLVYFSQRVLKRHTPIRSMKIEDIHAVCPKLLQTHFQRRTNILRRMLTRWGRVMLRSDCQAPLLPFSFSSECFLFSIKVEPGRIDLIVALSLEVIQDVVYFVKVCDACSRRWIWSEGC